MAGHRSAARRPVVVALLVVVFLALGFGIWFSISARSALNELTAARDSLEAARDAVADSQPDEAKAFMAAATSSAQSASARVNGPLWDVVAAVPGLGDTPQAAQAVATSLDQTLTALQPVVEQLNVLDPSSLISDDGQIDVSAIEQAVPALKQAQPGIEQANETMSTAPTGGWVLPQVSAATDELSEQLGTLQSSLSTAVTFGEIAGPLLGTDGEKRYFVGILNPNEARGTGGFLGNYAILSAKDGKITVDQVGSNTDLPNLTELPASLGKEFRYRYRDDPTLIGNMNLSPHFPDTSRIWLASWKQKTGEQLDGAIAADVVALGQLVQASGQQIPLPDGGSLSGDQVADFAIKGIYEKFPTAAQAAERKLYQEAVTTAAVKAVTSAPQPQAMAEALGQGLSEHHVVVWSADPKVEERLLTAGVGGSLQVADGHKVQFVALNGSGSKLDAYLERSVTYEVGRCPSSDGRVSSTVTAELVNAIPLGERPPEYMLSGIGPSGTTNVILAQFHLPNGSEVEKVTVNGKEVSWFPFTENGRPSAMVAVDLPPRVPVSVEVSFAEAEADGPGSITLQPLANEQQTVTEEASCT